MTSEAKKVMDEIATARIVAVSVGLSGLISIIPILAKGLLIRFRNPQAIPLDIIIAENLRHAAEYLDKELRKLLPKGYTLEERIGLI